MQRRAAQAGRRDLLQRRFWRRTSVGKGVCNNGPSKYGALMHDVSPSMPPALLTLSEDCHLFYSILFFSSFHLKAPSPARGHRALGSVTYIAQCLQTIPSSTAVGKQQQAYRESDLPLRCHSALEVVDAHFRAEHEAPPRVPNLQASRRALLRSYPSP